MASSITSAGAASGMDFESIISASLEAKRAQLESQTTTKKEEANVELSGVGQLKSALESFQSTLQAFTEDNAFNTRKITIDQPSDTTYFTVSAEDDVSNMYHDIIVEQLSSSQKITRNFDIGENDNAFQAGKLTFDLGKDEEGNARTFSIDIEEGDTLELIRKKINENDYGLTANYVKTEDGYQLTLDTGTTGSENNYLKITAEPDPSSGTAGADGTLTDAEGNKLQSLSQFAFSGYTNVDADNNGNPDDAADIDGWAVTAAKDAIIQVDGSRIRSDSNTFEGQISGITLTVNKVSAKDDDGNFEANSLTIEEDYSAMATKMQNFVSSYNSLMSTLDSLYEHNTYTDGENNYDGGYLAGNATVRALRNQLQNMVSSFGVSETTGQSIYNMGLSFEKDGTLELDSTTFKESLTGNFNLVVNAFSGDDGLLSQLDGVMEEYTKSSGILDEWEESLNSTISDLTAEENDNETYLEEYEASLRQKYSYLDTVMAGYNNSLTYLQSALSGI